MIKFLYFIWNWYNIAYIGGKVEGLSFCFVFVFYVNIVNFIQNEKQQVYHGEKLALKKQGLSLIHEEKSLMSNAYFANKWASLLTCLQT